MCGICGFIAGRGLAPRHLVAMNDAAAHRGPDGEGYFLVSRDLAGGKLLSREEALRRDGGAWVGLGHRRLAILDLSPVAAQPMQSHDATSWIVLNGEVYNYLELRSELEQRGRVFRSTGDTEVALAAFQEWGTDCFSRFNGMWGLAILDLENRVVVLSRDRLGIKPLYVWRGAEGLAFSSEIKQLLTLPMVKAVANPRSVVEYVDTGYEGRTETLFAGIQALPAGSWFRVTLDDPELGTEVPFWLPEDLPAHDDDREATERIRELFLDSIKLQLRSDVPVGVSLSGGLDSSAIFGGIHRVQTPGAPSTHAFSARYDDREFDEGAFIKVVVDRFGGRQVDAPVRVDDFLENQLEFIRHHDEPPGSLSQYASWVVMRQARSSGVPVVLSGQGGDELFSGYWPAYYLHLRRSMRRPWVVASHLIGSMLPGGNPQLVRQAIPHLFKYFARRARSNRQVLSKAWARIPGLRGSNWALDAQAMSAEEYRFAELRQVHLPRLLKWDDRNSMAFGVEGRYPFLDHRLVELAMALPPAANLSRGWNKYLLRKALGELLPREIQWRRTKLGFVTPQAAWLASALGPELDRWVERPAHQLCAMVDRGKLVDLVARAKNGSHGQELSEDQALVVRLFFLDRWFRVFGVDLPEPLTGIGRAANTIH